MTPVRALVTLVLAAGLACPAACALAKSQKGKAVYGAIAVNRDTRGVGYAYDFKNAQEAKREALKQCGGGKCELLTSFKNGCAAVAEGRNRLTMANGMTRDEAETKATRKCGADCRILAWACTK
jgi:Domain of unknown function (DUF4189)